MAASSKMTLVNIFFGVLECLKKSIDLRVLCLIFIQVNPSCKAKCTEIRVGNVGS